MGWIILVLLALGGYFVYNYLVALEKEIRAEISAAEEMSRSGSDQGRDDGLKDQNLSPEQMVEAVIAAHPGILQSDLYGEVLELDRKTLQKTLLELDRSGRVLRVRSGNTFQLNLAG